MFESSVNSEGIETYPTYFQVPNEFESSVNSEGIETSLSARLSLLSLRAV